MLSLNNNKKVMKTAKLLRNFLDVLIALLALSIIITIVMILIFSFNQGEFLNPLPEKFKHIDVNSWKVTLFLLFFIAEYILLLIGLFFLRKSVTGLMTGNYYTEKVINHFEKAGNILIVVGLTSIFLRFLVSIVIVEKVAIDIDFTTNALLFVSITGLFFKLFSSVFADAKKLKTENDLTI